MAVRDAAVALLGAVWRFARRRAVLCVSALAALATVAIVPPDAAYAGYLDMRTIVCLFCVLAVAGALRNAGAFERAARIIVGRFKTRRAATVALVAATTVLSMLATNDMALIMMLPLATATLVRAGWVRLAPVVFVLLGLTANLGGMIVPFGNPQNLYLYSFFSIDLASFLEAMALPFAASMALVLACAVLLPSAVGGGGKPDPLMRAGRKRGGRHGAEGAADAGESSSEAAAFGGEPAAEASSAKGAPTASAKTASVAPASSEGRPAAGDDAPLDVCRFALCVALLCLTVGSVLRVVPVALTVVVVVVALAFADRRALRGVDYALLLTFVCFFVFAGNMARIPAVNDAMGALMEGFPLLASAGLSQVISNVPAAVLLSHFTDAWQPLLVGVNIGGAGTLVGSLANLIVLQHYLAACKLSSVRAQGGLSTKRFMAVFSALNAVFLAVLVVSSVFSMRTL